MDIMKRFSALSSQVIRLGFSPVQIEISLPRKEWREIYDTYGLYFSDSQAHKYDRGETELFGFRVKRIY